MYLSHFIINAKLFKICQAKNQPNQKEKNQFSIFLFCSSIHAPKW